MLQVDDWSLGLVSWVLGWALKNGLVRKRGLATSPEEGKQGDLAVIVGNVGLPRSTVSLMCVTTFYLCCPAEDRDATFFPLLHLGLCLSRARHLTRRHIAGWIVSAAYRLSLAHLLACFHLLCV